MRKISFFLATTLVCSIGFLSCQKVKDGEPGPKGDSGESLIKGGTITSEISGTNTSGDDFNEKNISYQYYKNTDDNIFYKTTTNIKVKSAQHAKTAALGETTYNIRLKRYDATGTNFLMLEIEMTPYDTLARYIDYKYINPDNDIAFLDGNYYDLPFTDDKVQISGYSYDYVDFSFDNFQFDPATGKISFGFNADYRYDYNSTGNDATLSGTVDLTLKGAALKQSATK